MLMINAAVWCILIRGFRTATQAHEQIGFQQKDPRWVVFAVHR